MPIPMVTGYSPSPPSHVVLSETPLPLATSELRRRFQAIVNDSRYSHFTRIPERIVRFLERLHIKCDRDTVLERLLAHYLFIAIVDDAIDSGEEGAAQTVFECFSDGPRRPNEFSRLSDITIVTEVLKSQIAADNWPAMLHLLRRAHREVIGESTA